MHDCSGVLLPHAAQAAVSAPLSESEKPDPWVLGQGAAPLPAGAQVTDAFPLQRSHPEAWRSAQSIPCSHRRHLGPNLLSAGAPSLESLGKCSECLLQANLWGPFKGR